MASCVSHSQHVQLTLLPAGDGDSLRGRAWPQCLRPSRSRTSSSSRPHPVCSPSSYCEICKRETYRSDCICMVGIDWNMLCIMPSFLECYAQEWDGHQLGLKFLNTCRCELCEILHTDVHLLLIDWCYIIAMLMCK